MYYNLAQIVDAEQQRCVTEIEHTMVKYLAKNNGTTTADVNQYHFTINRKYFPNRNLKGDVYALDLIDEYNETLGYWICDNTTTVAIILASFYQKLEVANYYECIRLGISSPKIVGYIHRGEYVNTARANRG